MPPQRHRKPGTKRRRRVDERKKRIRNVLIGGAVVFAVFGVVGAMTLYELQIEAAERERAAQAQLAALAAKKDAKAARTEDASPSKAPRKATPRPGGEVPRLQLKGLKELKLGLTRPQVRELLGEPDASSLANHMKYDALGIDLVLNARDGGSVGAIRLTAPLPPGAELPPDLAPIAVNVGDPPQVLAQVAPDAKVLYHQASGTYTAYDPQRQVAIDFDRQRVLSVRQQSGLDAEFQAAMMLRGNQSVSFNQAFSTKMTMGSMLTDAQLDVTVKPAGNSRLPAHEVTLKLKTDGYDPDSLRTMIKRQVNTRMSAGDMAVAVHVLGPKGNRIVSCDWYSPRYAGQAGAQPQRFGSLDSSDNISYRWY